MTTSDRRPVVLLVDGDDDGATRARTAVERAVPRGRVVHASSAEAALARAVDDAVDCVVTAWTLPDRDGASFLAALRERRPSVPVVLLTDEHPATEAVAEAVETADVDDVRRHCTDPVTDRLLGRSVAALVEANTADRPTVRPAANDVTTATDGVAAPESTHLLDESGYRRLVEQNIAGIYVIEDRAFTYVNPRMAELFGTTQESMVGRPVLSYVAPADRARVRRNLEARENGDSEHVRYEFTAVRADGCRIDVEASGGRVVADDSVGIVGILVDVTERRQSERQVRRLSQAVEHAAHGIYVTDADGTITYVNPAFESITGYDAADVVGENPRVLNSGRMNDAYYDEMYDHIYGGEVWQATIVDRRASGELYHARQTIAPIHDQAGHVEGFVAVQEDVTEERIRRQVLQVLHRVLRHNVRNELNVIAGHAEVLAEELTVAGDTTGVASAEAILRATAELRELSDRATEAEDALADEANERRAMDLVELLRQQWRGVADDADALHVEGPAVAAVTADVTLGVAVRELLRAAAPDDDGGARVTVREDGGEVELRLRTEESVASEWSLVRQGVETPLEHASDLDLWVVKWVVTRLGGDVSLTDEGEASVLTVRLPAAPQSAATDGA